MMQCERIVVEHEPFTDAYYFGNLRSSDRYGETQRREGLEVGVVVDRLWAQAQVAEREGVTLFVKELAFQALPYVPDALLVRARHSFVVRRPDSTMRQQR